MEELPGRIGPYEVRDRLGHGGMGVVYLGFDPMLDRPVAIKVLKVPDEETRRRFLREARLAARVHHPHIVSIYAVGEHEGNPYLAMEFIAGRTMAQIIRGGEQVPLARKVHWLSELCAGLAHAHQSGIVHRDVKPSNLLIAQSTGTLRLLDFGIAHGNEASSMTMAGMIVGTPQYMSPEQIQGQSVDARSDIFSVGAVAYELLTGRQAFGGDNLYHVSRQIVSEQPRPLESFVPDAPSLLIRTIAKCLQKDPAERPESAALLERDFLAIARRLDPDHTLVVRPAEPTVMAPAKDATTSRRELLREAEAAIEQGELTTASGLLQKLEAHAPSSDVLQLRQKLQSRRVQVRVQDALTRADEAVQTGTVEEAESALTTLAEIAPRHPDLGRLRLALQTRMDARQVASLTSRARQALQQDKLEEAEALVAEALALAPDAADALAVQQTVLDRTRAQRIARLVAQASRALDQDDAAGARRAIEALLRVDPAHRDVARLQGRLQALTAEMEDAAAGPMTPAKPAPVPAAPAPPAPASASAAAARVVKAAPVAATVGAGHEGGRARSAAPVTSAAPPPPAAARAKETVPAPARPAAARPPQQASTPAAVAGDAGSSPADRVLLRHLPTSDDTRPEDTKSATLVDLPAQDHAPAGRWVLLAIVALALLALGGGGAYYALVRAPGGTASDSQPPVVSTPPSPRTAPQPGPAPPPAVIETAGRDTPEPEQGPADEPEQGPAAPEPVADEPSPPTPPVPTPTPRKEPWTSVRQLTARGAFDRAMTAIDQVQGVAPSDRQAERTRVVESARRTALAARRVAEDFGLTSSPQYIVGVNRQAQADKQSAAGRLKSAVSTYMLARRHFVQAVSGRPSPPPDDPVVEPPPPEPAGPEPTKPAERGPDLSTWSNEEARTTIAQFCGAYRARDIGGLNRLWPNMGPEWRTELRDAFGTSGELVCVFENVVIVRASDEFSASAVLLTQLPGEDQRRRRLVISLVPARDRLVIGNFRVR